MMGALERHPVPLMVAQTLRYNAVVRALRAELASIGPIRALTFTQRFEPSPLGWLDDPTVSGGGATLHTGVHGFDLMRWLSGLEPDAVSCQRASIHTRRTEDNFVATISLGGGAALATVACSRSAGARNGTIEIAGERGSLFGDHVLNRAQRVVGTAIEPLPIGSPAATVREIVADFVAALRAGAAMPITIADGLRAVALVDACAAAAETGRTVRVESIG